MLYSKTLILIVTGLSVFFVFRSGVAQEYVEVEPATFTRGADVAANVYEAWRETHYGPDWDEGPKHKVELSSFRIARQQVSMSQFAGFMPSYRQRIESAGLPWQNESPAVLVSWNEADAYCKWFSKSAGIDQRLPTEAEWELAASRAKELKLSGIADGVQEWCLDWWAPYPGKLPLPKNPCGPREGSIVRVHRDGGGGSVAEEPKDGESVTDFRVTDRSATVPDDRRSNLGFRVVIGEQPNFVESSKPISDLPGKVSLDLHDWNDSKKDAAWFRAGGKFINPGEGTSAVVPYWNRHHVPSLTWCDNGDLLATAFTAPVDNSDQMAILITRLPRGKETWTTATRFFVAPDHNVTSSALFRAEKNLIHHYNGIGSNRCDDFSMIKRVSRDNGVTWSQPKIVHRFSAGTRNPESPRLWPHMDLKSCQLEDQRVLLMSTDVAGDDDSGSAIFISRDNGDSWNELTRTGWNASDYAKEGKSAGWIAGIHAPVETLADGSLMAIGRSDNMEGFAPLSRSFDFGKTWTYSASPFPSLSSGQRSVLLRLKEGPLLFIGFTDTVSNVRNQKKVGMQFRDAAGEWQAGYGTFAAISNDDGKTWTQRKLIPNWHKKPWRSRNSGYLSCVQTLDGMIHLVSSSHYYRFNLLWLQEPMEQPSR